jgi:hypothetical protein
MLQNTSFNARFLTRLHIPQYVIACSIALLVSSGVIAYKTILYESVNGDEIVLLESEQAKADVAYPDRQLLSVMGYDTYLYPKVIQWLHQWYSISEYTYIITFVSVFLTVYCAYLAMRMLGFSFLVAMGTSLVALFPRFGPIDEFGGMFMVTGRTFALPAVWLLSAYYIKRRIRGKTVYPIFFAIGIASYIHPASLIMFFVLLSAIHFCLEVSDHRFGKALVDTLKNSGAFAVGAVLLLIEIIKRSSIATDVVGMNSFITTSSYIDALRYRVPFEFVDVNLIWMRHVAIVSLFFFGTAGYVLYAIRTGKIKKNSERYHIALWGAWAMVLAFILHIAIPGIQMFAVETYGAPYVLWFFARMFKYYYLGLLLIYGVALSIVVETYGRRWAMALVLCGILSSSFFFEWGQFLIGYPNYQKEFVPAALQDVAYSNQYDWYTDICTAFADVGAKKGDIVLAGDFSLRFFCGLRPYTTREEGTAHLFLGKASIVEWHRDIILQNAILTGTSSASVLWYAQRVGATAVVLPRESVAVSEFLVHRYPLTIDGNNAIIGL